MRRIDKMKTSRNFSSELLTVSQLADLLKITTGSIYNKICRGELDYFKIFGKVRFDANYINQLIENSRIKSKQSILQEINTD